MACQTLASGNAPRDLLSDFAGMALRFQVFLLFIGARKWLVLAMEIAQLAQVLAALGCPAERTAEMAAQLDKRARQLAGEKKQPYDEALRHLITLMRQGWAAKEKGF
jgi:hypothetical protein